MVTPLMDVPNLHHHHRSSPALPSSPCSTGCIFGSAHDHATYEEANACINHENFASSHIPRGIAATSLPPPASDYHSQDDVPLADLIAQYGTSSSTAWLDSSKYKIWRPSQPIPESTFKPVQGYIRKDPFVFAWGNPLVSSPTALEKTARAFIAFAEANHLRPVWSCVDANLESILADSALGWITVSCVYEDILDPAHVIDIMEKTKIPTKGNDADEIQVAEDLVQNLHAAEVEHVEVHELGANGKWVEGERDEIERGIKEWKKHGSMLTFESMTPYPWVDEVHRRYWVAKCDGKVVGVVVLTKTGPLSWQIVECIAFVNAPKGTSEMLIYSSLKDLQTEQEQLGDAGAKMLDPPESDTESHERIKDRLRVSFGITASNHLQAGHNISGWSVSVLSTTYQAVWVTHGLNKSGQYRDKFQTVHEPMFVCYPANGFGLIAVGAFLMALRS